MIPPHYNRNSTFFNQSPSIYWALFFLLIFATEAFAQKKKQISVGPGGGNIEISPLELRETMNDFFYKFARSITESADSIIQQSPDSSIDQEALTWKINAIPIASEAIYSSDAFLGYIDMAVFTYQMKLYFDTGAGKDLFGDHQQIALNTLDLLWKDLLEIGRNLVPDNDISEGTKIVTDFAEEHPLTSSYFVRQSTIPLMAKIQNVEKVTFKALASDMSQSLDEMRSQISSYMEVLPKQVRWETEYLINQAMNSPALTSRFDSLSNLLERSILVLESSPELIEKQRLEAFKDISKERLAVIRALRIEREIILDEIKNERAIVLEEFTKQLNLQREATFEDLTTLTNHSLDKTFDRMEGMIDTLYWRTAIMIGVLVVLVFIGLIVYKKV
ncbi:hypothetical protein [Algoriphagus pacificus]|uniref:Uncharacterized protein n=1 Tax=Algoriphagus pacificus TaxID=2811234 RepID=A0ABS3CDJ4_9BACT|nr:hypothetical protein [Algoriphagus pacificus]MBN7815165.1 hypothetical protein [Algoriphagus pacificus]